METIKELLTNIIRAIVNNPDEVMLSEEISEDENGKFNLINVKVNQEDVGLCIGTKGATAEAIRRIIGIAGYKVLGERVHVNIDAPRLERKY